MKEKAFFSTPSTFADLQYFLSKIYFISRRKLRCFKTTSPQEVYNRFKLHKVFNCNSILKMLTFKAFTSEQNFYIPCNYSVTWHLLQGTLKIYKKASQVIQILIHIPGSCDVLNAQYYIGMSIGKQILAELDLFHSWQNDTQCEGHRQHNWKFLI